MYNDRSMTNTVFASNVGSIADSILDKFSRKMACTSIFNDWNGAVGEEFASKSAPYKIIGQEGKKILVLKSKKGCSVELQHCSLQILEKVHRFLGKQFFSSIKVVQMDSNDSF